MADPQAEQVARLVKTALDLAPENWVAFLDAEPDLDASTRADIESLLRQNEGATRFLETPAVHYAAETLIREGAYLPGQTIGGYTIVSLIGRGGMGEVYLAKDRELHRQVALKFVHRSMASQELIRHFKREEHLLASLNHPNIAQLYGSGLTTDGIPFFAMEYIEGESLDRYCEQHSLPTSARLELFRKVCGAVSYAHQHLVVHRDLKPANIRVTAGGEPKLLDFGIAKLLETEGQSRIDPTLTLRGVMTPEYASPEQIEGDTITTASDVYSLGVIFYKLLTGQSPYRTKTARPDEIARAITDQEPVRPSDARSAPDLPAVHRKLKGDLDNIALMAIRKDPARRYASAARLSEDIRRHLDGQPVLARRDTFSYRASKFIARNKIGVAAAVLVFLAIMSGLTMSLWQARIARRERDRARAEQLKAQRVNDFMESLLGFANPGWYSPSAKKGRDVTIGQVLDEAASRVDKDFADQPQIRAELQRNIGTSYFYQTRYNDAERYLRAALETFTALHGDDDPDTARTVAALADILFFEDKSAEAESLYRRALRIYRKESNNPSFDALWHAAAAADMGLLLSRNGDEKQAEELWEEVFALGPKLKGNDRAPIAIVKADLANVYSLRGDLDRAETLLRESWDEFKTLPSGERYELGVTLTELGNILTVKGKLDEAEPLLHEGAELYRKVLDVNSPYLARNLEIQARLLLQKGDIAGAANAIEESAKIYERGHFSPASSFSTTVTRALIISKSGRLAEAEVIVREALGRPEIATRQSQLLIAIAHSIRGECLVALKRYDEAEPLLIESYHTIKTSQGAHNPRTNDALRRLIALYEAWPKPELAAQYRALL
jgi:eukaryotic-like serine/threonine-protein kinase